jgi:hypothetical protein
MKSITTALAVFTLFCVNQAYAETFEFTWQSQAWTKTYETPTDPVVRGPFTLSGTGTVTFSEIAGGAAEIRFDDGHGGSLVASGDGTYNGPMSFRTANNETRNGLGVLTPTADGFTLTVGRAASGPDAGATLVGEGTRPATGAGPAASEPAAESSTGVVGRAAGPGANATFAGAGTRLATDSRATVAASEPLTAAVTLAGLAVAGLLARRRLV